jgi:hypothetical protein
VRALARFAVDTVIPAESLPDPRAALDTVFRLVKHGWASSTTGDRYSPTRGMFALIGSSEHLSGYSDTANTPTGLGQEVAVSSPHSGTGRALAGATAMSGATLRVDREAIPHLRKVFDSAMSKLDTQIEIAMTGLRVSAWAGDPVSQTAAAALNDHSVDGTDSALNALRAYQQQLKSASDALARVAQEYQIVESDNADTFRSQRN